MTTPPHPCTQNARSRKRPAPETSEPSSTSLIATANPITSIEMNYFGLPTTSAENTAGDVFGNNDGAQALSTSQTELYRHSASPHYDANNQLTRVPRANQLIRIPSFSGMGSSGIPQQVVSAGQIPMNLGILEGTRIGQSGAFEQQVQNIDTTDREILNRIEKMKKKRSNIPPFVLKLSSFVNDPKTDDLIRWSPSGNSFMVIDEDEFSKTLIPDLFKHNNYASFVRQLNMYGFHKVVGLADGSLKTSEQRSKPPSEYENPYFKRGQPDLMWLIQKPKSKTARGKGKKGVKQEDPDTDKDDNGSDGGGADGDISGGYIEGPKDTNDGLHHSGGRNQRVDVQAVVSQIEAVRNHQAMISAAINRLREDHQQLYEQSLAFQNLHDRHENSINAILAFLATVYDKSLAAHAGGAVSNLFSNQVDQGIHNATPGSTAGQTPNGAIIPTTTTARQAVMRTPQMNRRRKPLLLEGVPGFSDGIANGEMEALQAQNLSNSTIQTNGLPLQQNNYQTLPPSPTIQEVFTPAPGGNATSPSDSPQLQHVEQQLNGVKQPTLTSTIPFSPSKNQTNSPIIPSGSHPNSHFTPSTTDLPIPSPTSAGNIPVPSPIALPKENTPPFLGTALALQEHNASLAQKSQEIEELEGLQTKQNHNIDQLMGLMRNFSEIVEPPGNTDDDVAQDVEQFFDFGLQGDTFSGGDVLGEGGVDIDELLRGVEADHQQNLTLSRVLDVDQGVLMTASSSSSSTGSRSREEVDGDAEEGQPKRRKVN